MSLIDHVRACNTYRAERFLPLVLGGTRIGRVRRDNADALRRCGGLFSVGAASVELRDPGGFDALSRAFDEAIEALLAEGRLEKWRNECFAVAPRWGEPPLFKIDRGAVAFFGIRGYGVHLNGRRRGPGGETALWIGRRAADKRVAPNKLDNMVAGGIAFGHGVFATLAKEAGEEATIPPELIARARPAGAVSYRMETRMGLRDDVLFVYDLEVPEDFTPRNSDGEIAEFHLMAARDVVGRVRDGDDFKFNVSLVIIDFALRHGLVGPDERDYLDLVCGLRQSPG